MEWFTLEVDLGIAQHVITYLLLDIVHVIVLDMETANGLIFYSN